MCMVSAILDYGRTAPWPVAVPDLTNAWKQYMEMLKVAQEFDKTAKQPDCEDPEKKKWFDAMEKRIAELEKKVNAVS